MNCRRAALLVIMMLVVATPAALAQAAGDLPQTVRALGAGTPLRTGPGTDSPILISVREGTLLEVQNREGDWYRVTVAPDVSLDGKTHTAYVLARLVSAGPASPVGPTPPSRFAPPPSDRFAPPPSDRFAPPPSDRSAPPPNRFAPPSTPATTAPPLPQAPRFPGPSPAAYTPPEQRGDVAVGYAFLHDASATLPLGFTVSDAWRVHPNIDIVGESQLVHGSPEGVSANIFAIGAGVRFSGGSRYGNGTTTFGQVLAGVVRVSASDGFDSGTAIGFGFQPGVGLEVPMSPKVALRPQVDFVIGRISGVTTRDLRINISVVFRLFKR